MIKGEMNMDLLPRGILNKQNTMEDEPSCIVKITEVNSGRIPTKSLD